MDSRRSTQVPVPVILNKSSGSEDEKAEERLRAAFQKAGARADLQRAESGEDVVRLATGSMRIRAPGSESVITYSRPSGPCRMSRMR